MRHSVKRRMNARGRPHRRQRLCAWLLKRGGRSDLAIMDFFAKSGLQCEVQPVRLAGLPFSTEWADYRSLAVTSPWRGGGHGGHLRIVLALEGHAQQLKQTARFLVGARGGDDRNFQAARLVDLVVVDLGED